LASSDINNKQKIPNKKQPPVIWKENLWIYLSAPSEPRTQFSRQDISNGHENCYVSTLSDNVLKNLSI